MQELLGKALGPSGRYSLTALMARGGFGAVYRAWDASLQREVALKVLIPALLHEPMFVERFRREALAVARLRHPHILEVYDFGEEPDGMLYLVMPLISGGTLKDRFLERDREPWSPAEAHALSAQLLPALDVAHQRGIVHRDVKPANVLLELDWAWLADFGIARMALGDTGVPGNTLTGAATIGTPEYMAPEQVAPDPDRPLDGRADLYAFGVVLYEILTGRVPFKGETTWETCMQVMQAPLPRPRELNPALSPAVEAVLLQALARNRDERFANGSALEAALRDAVAAEADHVPSRRAPDAATVRTAEQAEPARVDGQAHARAAAAAASVDAPVVRSGATWRDVAPRLARALRFDTSVYDEVKADASRTALVEAAIVVGVTGGLSIACLTIMLFNTTPSSASSARFAADPFGAAIGGVVGALAGWATWCILCTALGTGLFKGSGTNGQLLRTAGLAQIPGAFSIVALVPTMGILLILPVAAWTFIAQVGALRQTLRITTPASVATALLAGVVSSPVQWLVTLACASVVSSIAQR